MTSQKWSFLTGRTDKDGELRIVGRSAPLKTAAARELARWLQPPGGVPPWHTTVKGTTLDRLLLLGNTERDVWVQQLHAELATLLENE